MIYIDGKPILDQEARSAAAEVWNWFPKVKRDLLLDQAFEAVRRLHTPPVGESFLDHEGRPYSDPAQFADDLAVEFRERLFKLLRAKSQIFSLDRDEQKVEPATVADRPGSLTKTDSGGSDGSHSRR